jgi:hypothetical protein
MFGACSSGGGGARLDMTLLAFVDCAATVIVCSARRLHEAAVIDLASQWRCASCWTTCLALSFRAKGVAVLGIGVFRHSFAVE